MGNWGFMYKMVSKKGSRNFLTSLKRVIEIGSNENTNGGLFGMTYILFGLMFGCTFSKVILDGQKTCCK